VVDSTKRSDAWQIAKPFSSAPPTALPRQILTVAQRGVVAGLTGRLSYRIQLRDRCDWFYAYTGSDLRLLVSVYKKVRPQEHVWLFDGVDRQLRTLGEVADVLLRRQQAGQTLANLRD